MTGDDPRLTLCLAAPKVTSDQFGEAVDAFFDLLHEVSREYAGGPNEVRWIVTVERGSALLHATPEMIKPRALQPIRVSRALSKGVGVVERRAQRPRFFTDNALRITKDLARTRASVLGPTGAVQFSQKAAENVDRLLGVAVEDYGTVEGRLQTLSERRGPHFAVYDDLTDQAVRCNIDRDRLDDAWRAFGRRVAVSGLIRYRKNGEPLSVDADDIIVFPDDALLPTAEDMCGILRNGNH